MFSKKLYGAPRTIKACRICGNEALNPVVDLGLQSLTGRFPAAFDEPPPVWPVTLVRCDAEASPDACGSSQLLHLYDQDAFFGPLYGYRSSVTQTMRDHLRNKAQDLITRTSLGDGDAVLDIGCNDGTLLSNFLGTTKHLFGCDPSAGQFAATYDPSIKLAVDFFPSDTLTGLLGGQKLKVVTSIAMFYDVDDPIKFSKTVKGVLASDGLWEIEIAYMPRIMQVLGYDTVLHEHAVYYGLSQIEWIATKAGLRVVHAAENTINGASLRILLTHAENSSHAETDELKSVRQFEAESQWSSRANYDDFAMRVLAQRDEFKAFLERCQENGLKAFGYGASTKGNAVLQYCGVTREQIPYMLERYPPKYGLLTPGTALMIIPEEQGRAMKPDVLIVFIWQFKEEALRREAEFLAGGGRIVFAFPTLQVYGPKGLETAASFFDSVAGR